MQETLEKLSLKDILPSTDEKILAYLRYSYKLAEIADLAEHDTLILNVCEQLSITVSEAELQVAGDKFRQENKLLGASETLAWLSQQRISVEDWSQGIQVTLLTQKLKEHLFGAAVDSHYLANRNDYKRVALSQILVSDLTTAMKITQALRQEEASFCALALEYSKGKQSKENGGFAGVRFITELMAEISGAIADHKEGDIIGPVQTKLGYHIIRLEKWFHPELNQVRDQILESLFQGWLQANIQK
ncbi:peptidylprolyl isomerase [Anabaena cylindrica UHCC 0172]|uniref:peptidylprolyl isomerase n=1 Tax=Anabaena cylindrica TaxID=1165 RepID=UPI002B21BA5B|nr:peptidylprolyl isomerase [Anabaena cylindrica]MEA5552444.1 peptidylprolyl isomerase [Anabaena cylindrica UHCC 0172]